MKPKTLLITPPFTQMNTPYPATAYLKGFLQTLGYAAAQADLGMDVLLRLFSRAGLQAVFDELETREIEVSENVYRMYQLRQEYLNTIEPVIRFLQHTNPTLAHRICDQSYLPEGSRFQHTDELEDTFGTMGIQDKARHLATLYLEDLADLIKETIDPHFGFSRYAERLGRTTTHFDEMETALKAPDTLVTRYLQQIVEEYIRRENPQLVCLSVPFPGNLFAALKTGQYLKTHYPEIKIALGGGYANTELRRLREPRVFDYIDYVCLDDGETPLLCLLQHIEGLRPAAQLKRTFVRTDEGVRYLNGAPEKDIPQREVGTPDYEGLPLRQYLSVIELTNPMHSLWSNGRWNKLTLAHGCYWGKCTFCDISLDYIGRYEPVDAAQLCDRMEAIMVQTGENGFHFVDEAAPPALMRDLALEILHRGLTVVWWTNIRFEKRFTPDLCRLLKASGCIAVSGGLEVASDRLLEKMKKGVTVGQVARVAHAFTEAGIMVHAYLMYGFPTQTAQETIDSLEMVRQMFDFGILQSGFWHHFAMTAHSPVGLNPAAYSVVRTGPEFGGFADNDLFHDDPEGADHEAFSEGLRQSLHYYMLRNKLNRRLGDWFNFAVPETSVSDTYIMDEISNPGENHSPTSRVTWVGPLPEKQSYINPQKRARLTFYLKKEDWILQTSYKIGEWLYERFPRFLPGSDNPILFQELKTEWEEERWGPFEDLLQSDLWSELKTRGLIMV
ncbi:MAG: radical SAM protein [Bacteroidia bacterium]|nr:radical SAM protein [Bacteroidia bacterium]